MKAEDGTVRFERVSEAHLPMLAAWLAEPHVRQWWGDPDEEIELIRTGQESGETDGYVAHFNGEAVGYIQSWRPSDYDDEPWAREMPRDTIGLDIFIGRPDMIGRGVGARIIRAFAEQLFEAGTPRLIIDPDGRNARAISAYTNAGFAKFAEHRDARGVTVLMEITPESFSRTA